MTEEEDKCVSSSCHNNEDCMKKLAREADKYECKEGLCKMDFDQIKIKIKIEFDKLSLRNKRTGTYS